MHGVMINYDFAKLFTTLNDLQAGTQTNKTHVG